MKYPSNPVDTEREPMTEAPASASREKNKPVEELLASFPMKTAVSLPRDMRRPLAVLCAVLVLTLVLGTTVLLIGGSAFRTRQPLASPDESDAPYDTSASSGGTTPDATYPYADGKPGSALLTLPSSAASPNASQLSSGYAVVADVGSGEILASYLGDEPMFPASMTKVMTLIVAVEGIPHEGSLQDIVTISEEVYDKMVAEGSSGVGLEPGEQLTVESLLYALILQSDGIAAGELARYLVGGEEELVARMNQKAADMGLAHTHFENTTGLHHPNHRSTAREMASIMAYAMNMTLCRRILTTEYFPAPFTMANGVQKTYQLYHTLLVTQFERNSVHQPRGTTVIAGKTGYTPEAGTCLVTYAETPDGHGYVCVTANAPNYAGCIRDYITLYDTYTKP